MYTTRNMLYVTITHKATGVQIQFPYVNNVYVNGGGLVELYTAGAYLRVKPFRVIDPAVFGVGVASIGGRL